MDERIKGEWKVPENWLIHTTAKFIDILWGSEDHIAHKSIFGVYVSTNYSLALLPHPSLYPMVVLAACKTPLHTNMRKRIFHSINSKKHKHTQIINTQFTNACIREMLTSVYSNNNNNCDVSPHIDTHLLTLSHWTHIHVHLLLGDTGILHWSPNK